MTRVTRVAWTRRTFLGARLKRGSLEVSKRSMAARGARLHLLGRTALPGKQSQNVYFGLFIQPVCPCLPQVCLGLPYFCLGLFIHTWCVFFFFFSIRWVSELMSGRVQVKAAPARDARGRLSASLEPTEVADEFAHRATQAPHSRVEVATRRVHC